MATISLSKLLFIILVTKSLIFAEALKCYQCGQYNDGVGSITPCLNYTEQTAPSYLKDCPRSSDAHCIVSASLFVESFNFASRFVVGQIVSYFIVVFSVCLLLPFCSLFVCCCNFLLFLFQTSHFLHHSFHAIFQIVLQFNSFCRCCRFCRLLMAKSSVNGFRKC